MSAADGRVCIGTKKLAMEFLVFGVLLEPMQLTYVQESEVAILLLQVINAQSQLVGDLVNLDVRVVSVVATSPELCATQPA